MLILFSLLECDSLAVIWSLQVVANPLITDHANYEKVTVQTILATMPTITANSINASFKTMLITTKNMEKRSVLLFTSYLNSHSIWITSSSLPICKTYIQHWWIANKLADTINQLWFSTAFSVFLFPFVLYCDNNSSCFVIQNKFLMKVTSEEFAFCSFSTNDSKIF